MPKKVTKHYKTRPAVRPKAVRESQVLPLEMKTSQVDAKGRVTIGSQHKGKLYQVTVLPGGEVLLVPQQVVPESEAWLWQNPKALSSVKRGIEQARAGKAKAMSFAKYLKD